MESDGGHKNEHLSDSYLRWSDSAYIDPPELSAPAAFLRRRLRHSLRDRQPVLTDRRRYISSMTNFSSLFLGMLSFYVVALLLLVILWRTGLLFMGMNVAWEHVLKMYRLISGNRDGGRQSEDKQ